MLVHRMNTESISSTKLLFTNSEKIKQVILHIKYCDIATSLAPRVPGIQLCFYIYIESMLEEKILKINETFQKF